ncbi:MAG: MFS transporter [Planctomycetota bacterium]
MRIVDIRREELPALGWAASWFFCVLAAYYTIRPVRETFASALGSDEKARLFAITLVVMLLATPIYGWLVSRVGRRYLVPTIYGFFISNLLVFRWLLSGGEPAAWVSQAFFVWISVFNLFVVTLFWGTVVDLFRGDQGKRLFGLIFGAGTLGQLLSSWCVQATSQRLGVANLLWLSMALLAGAIVCSLNLRRQSISARSSDASTSKSGEVTWAKIWQGVAIVAKSPYLLGIAGFILSMSVCATTVYFQMTEMVGTQFENDEQRTSWFATVNAAQAIVTLVLQTVVVGWLLRNIGVGRTLALVPIVILLGFGALVFHPTLFVIGAFQVALRASSFSLGNPALEVLFTAVAPEQKYRAKAFIDTVGKRSGDVLGAQAYAWMQWLGWAAATLSLAMVPLAAGAIVLCLILGSAHEQAARIAQVNEADRR